MNPYRVTLPAIVSAIFALCANAAAQTAQRTPVPAPTAKTPASVQDLIAPSKQPMKVRLVRSNQPGCEPSCPEWISAEGTVDLTTPGEFRRVLARLGHRKLPIFINSPGGSMDPSFAVARMIRAKGLDVAVTKTTFAPCARTDTACLKAQAAGFDLGKPDPKISFCASACAFILAGGVNRYVGIWTFVGLHEIRSVQIYRLVRQQYRIERPAFGPPRKQILKQETVRSDRYEAPAEEKVYERVRLFFAEMGIAETIMPILRSAPHESMRWMRTPDLLTTKIATQLLNGEQLLMMQRAPVAAPQAPATMPHIAGPGTLIKPAVTPPATAAVAQPPMISAAPKTPGVFPPAGAAITTGTLPPEAALAKASEGKAPALAQPSPAAATAAGAVADTVSSAPPPKPKAVAKAKPKPAQGRDDNAWRPF